MASVIDEERFESHMARGVHAHTMGKHDNALIFRANASDYAETPIQKGRAYRDIATSIYSGGRSTEIEGSCKRWIAKSLEVLREDLENGNDSARREIGASVGWSGRIALKESIGVVLTGDEVDQGEFDEIDKQFGEVLVWSLPHEKAWEIDQYRLNILPVAGLARILAGNRKGGVAFAREAIFSAWRSESPRLETSTANLDTKDRYKSKAVVATRGAGVMAVAALTKLGSNKTAYSLANKLI